MFNCINPISVYILSKICIIVCGVYLLFLLCHQELQLQGSASCRTTANNAVDDSMYIYINHLSAWANELYILKYTDNFFALNKCVVIYTFWSISVFETSRLIREW